MVVQDEFGIRLKDARGLRCYSKDEAELCAVIGEGGRWFFGRRTKGVENCVSTPM